MRWKILEATETNNKILSFCIWRTESYELNDLTKAHIWYSSQNSFIKTLSILLKNIRFRILNYLLIFEHVAKPIAYMNIEKNTYIIYNNRLPSSAFWWYFGSHVLSIGQRKQSFVKTINVLPYIRLTFSKIMCTQIKVLCSFHLKLSHSFPFNKCYASTVYCWYEQEEDDL